MYKKTFIGVIFVLSLFLISSCVSQSTKDAIEDYKAGAGIAVELCSTNPDCREKVVERLYRIIRTVRVAACVADPDSLICTTPQRLITYIQEVKHQLKEDDEAVVNDANADEMSITVETVQQVEKNKTE